MELQAKRRSDDIDIAKALGMLAVMWGHLMLSGGTNSFVYGFHIPLFFFLSGLVFRSDRYPTLGQLFRRRCKTLLLPYVTFSVITWVYWVLRKMVFGEALTGIFRPLLQTVIAQGSGGFLSHNVALWFVTCLFVTEMLYWFISRLPEKLSVAAVLLCLVIGYFIVQPNSFFDFTLLPWSIESAFTAVVFYALGSRLNRRCGQLSEKAKAHKAPAAALALVLFAFVFIAAEKNGKVSLGHAVLGNNIFVFYLIALCGIAAVLLTSAVLAEAKGVVKRYLCWLGRHSFYAMAVHVPVMVDLVWLASKVGGADINALRNSYPYTVPIFVGMLLVTSLWIIVIGKIKERMEKQ